MRRILAASLLVGTPACGAAHPSSPDSLAGGVSPSVALPAPTPFTIPTPAASTSDLAFDLRLRTAFARGHLGDDALVDVEDGAYLFVAAAGTRSFAPSVALVRQALPALYDGRFSRHPTRAVTAYLFEDPADYNAFCRTRDAREHISPYGLYTSSLREIAVDQHYGAPSILHELTHAMLSDDMPTAPRWLREGIAELYEHPVISGTAIHGVTNKRRDTLLAAMRSPAPALRDLTTLDGLFSMPDYLFEEDAHPAEAPVANAVSRFFCQWLDSPGEDHLWKFEHAWRDHARDDPKGEKSFAAVTGQTPSEANAAWQKWVRSL